MRDAFCCLLVMNWAVSALHLCMERQIFVVEEAAVGSARFRLSKVNIN